MAKEKMTQAANKIELTERQKEAFSELKDKHGRKPSEEIMRALGACKISSINNEDCGDSLWPTILKDALVTFRRTSGNPRALRWVCNLINRLEQLRGHHGGVS